MVAGVPDIAGRLGARPVAANNNDGLWCASNTGAFYNHTTNINYGGSHAMYATKTLDNFTVGGTDFHASRANSIYGKSSTVTPLSYKTIWVIKY